MTVVPASMCSSALPMNIQFQVEKW
jgi:hypothetical protein